MYSSTCFGHPHPHHQELNNCGSILWFYGLSVVVAVLLFVLTSVSELFRVRCTYVAKI